jgi:hypothetical protein
LHLLDTLGRESLREFRVVDSSTPPTFLKSKARFSRRKAHQPANDSASSANLFAMAGSTRRHRVDPHFGCAALIAATAWALLSTPGAQAANVTVGSPLGASFIGSLNISTPSALANTSLS